MSSRLALDSKGRLVVEITASSEVGLRPGERFVVVGNDFECAGLGIRWLGLRTGRAPVAAEMFRRRNEGPPRS